MNILVRTFCKTSDVPKCSYGNTAMWNVGILVVYLHRNIHIKYDVNKLVVIQSVAITKKDNLLG